MDLTGNSVFLLCAGALILAVIGVLVDRLNFPQSRFRPKQIKPSQKGLTRDRTGAHILEVEEYPQGRVASLINKGVDGLKDSKGPNG